jgi:predicted TIM-barrel fold metal-dependent hydrolase
MKIIDSHQHVFWHGRDDAGLIADMNEHGIDLAWLLTWEIPQFPAYAETTRFSRTLNPARVRPDGTHPGILLEDLLIAHRNYPGRFILGFCPDPAKPNAPDLFEAACDMHGVKVCGEWKFRMLIDDPRSIELFRAAGRRKTPVVLHLDVPYLGGIYCAKWYGGTVENLARALDACPETTFIGHAPGFWRELSGDAVSCPEVYPKGPIVPGGRIAPMFERHPNLMADLSAGSALGALKRDPGFSKQFLQAHSDRLLFGRDFYGGELTAFLRSLRLGEETESKIFRENALSLIDPAASSSPGMLKLS